MLRKCKECGIEFDARRAAVTCSKACRADRRRAYHKQYSPLYYQKNRSAILARVSERQASLRAAYAALHELKII